MLGDGVYSIICTRPCCKRRGQCTVGVEASNIVGCGIVIFCEISTDEDLAVGLEGDSIDRAICSRPCGKCRVQCTVGVEAGKAVDGGAVICREVSADENFTVGLESGSTNSIVYPRPCCKCRVECAIGVEAGNTVGCGAELCSEFYTADDVEVGVLGDGIEE